MKQKNEHSLSENGGEVQNTIKYVDARHGVKKHAGCM
jgi:hypothetical protein